MIKQGQGIRVMKMSEELQIKQLSKEIEALKKTETIHKAQIRKLFNITTKLGEKIYGSHN
tara:strand:+ start:799 stop:978 length:180 start_codon:yes stop_codon:yes gene_type:complete